MLSSPIVWMGGKARRMKWLMPYFDVPHTTYCSVFGGGASDLLRKEPVDVEVYNDIDENLACLFRALQEESFNQFFESVLCTPYSRRERELCHDIVFGGTTDFMELVHAFYTCSRLSFGGAINRRAWGFAVSRTNGNMSQIVSTYARAVCKLPDIHRRLQHVIIHNEDWSHILDRYDGKQTLFYLDPPYVPGTRKSGGYQYEMSVADHKRLVNRLLRISGKVALSGYVDPVYQPLEDAGWQRIDFDVICMMVGRTRSTGVAGAGALREEKRVESLWLNY